MHTIGTVTLFPAGIAPVCTGDQLELTCNTTGMPKFLNWSITLVTLSGLDSDDQIIIYLLASSSKHRSYSSADA